MVDAYPRKWLTLAVLAVGTFVSTLDSSMVNISLPTITQALHTDLSTVQWVSTAYLLTLSSLLLSFGRLADILGRKKVYVAGFAIFSAAAGLGGIVQTSGSSRAWCGATMRRGGHRGTTRAEAK